jgi:BirA family biotin operon repressor/biotin-[acetyl-CoA-carboxylase] ligase
MTRAPRLPAAYHLIALGTVDSTNEEARRRAALGEAETPDGTLIWAESQTAGRGRRGRTWQSPPGNLYCSLVLRPECPVAKAAELGFVAALAVYDTVGSLAIPGTAAFCKWPNDVLVNDRKAAGLLLESEGSSKGKPEWVILGVGLNIAHFPEDAEYPATSLYAEGTRDVTVVDALETFARHFLTWTNRWLDDGFAPIRQNWLWRAKGVGETVQVRLERETLEGTFKDLDHDGALLLAEPGGRVRRIAAGDVFFPNLTKGSR